ncbi:MAG: uracil-DNA glycosylase [Alphaproteobacteria bacterium]|nr:uracil-DNA glycosylase [Alphaproteobacteria bacterium]MBO6863711.1 uracil-DNA glycosylase [Alphaproteobacteria bacterium]
MTVGDGNVLENDAKALISALEWQVAMGVDEAIAGIPVDRYAQAAARRQARADQARSAAPPQMPVAPAPRPRADADSPLGAAEAAAAGQKAARECKSLDDLRQALENFDGCSLRNTATQLVFGDGNPLADIMVIGEAPGADEDRQGKPFVGVSGQLLDRMLSFIGLTRETFYITNTVYWRPPGNRKPNDGEFAVCRPFVDRHIELIDPKLLLLVGDKSVRGLAGATTGITRSRGQWYDVKIGDKTIPALATFHPAYLLRTPAAKRQAWQDLLTFQRRMRELGLG